MLKLWTRVAASALLASLIAINAVSAADSGDLVMRITYQMDPERGAGLDPYADGDTCIVTDRPDNTVLFGIQIGDNDLIPIAKQLTITDATGTLLAVQDMIGTYDAELEFCDIPVTLTLPGATFYRIAIDDEHITTLTRGQVDEGVEILISYR